MVQLPIVSVGGVVIAAALVDEELGELLHSFVWQLSDTRKPAPPRTKFIVGERMLTELRSEQYSTLVQLHRVVASLVPLDHVTRTHSLFGSFEQRMAWLRAVTDLPWVKFRDGNPMNCLAENLLINPTKRTVARRLAAGKPETTYTAGQLATLTAQAGGHIPDTMKVEKVGRTSVVPGLESLPRVPNAKEAAMKDGMLIVNGVVIDPKTDLSMEELEERTRTARKLAEQEDIMGKLMGPEASAEAMKRLLGK